MSDMIIWQDPTRQHNVTAYLKKVRKEGCLDGPQYTRVNSAIAHLRRLIPHVSATFISQVHDESLPAGDARVRIAARELLLWTHVQAPGQEPIPGFNFHRAYERFLFSPIRDSGNVVVPFNEECARQLQPYVPEERAQAETCFLMVVRMFRLQYESTGFARPAASRTPRSLDEALLFEAKTQHTNRVSCETVEEAERLLLRPPASLPDTRQRPTFWQLVRFHLRRIFLRRGWAELSDELMFD